MLPVEQWVQAVVFGIVQGLTEFLPISSSAHLRLTAALAGWEDPGAAFTAVTQLGTETAVLIYFRTTIWAIVSTWTRSLWTPALRSTLDARTGWYVIVGTLPIAVLGLLLEDLIDEQFRDLRLVAAALGVFALVLAFADRRGSKAKELDELTLRDSVLFGFAQALALVPGVSRSGAVLTALRLLGVERAAAQRFSLLMSLPVAAGAAGLTLAQNRSLPPGWVPGALAAAVAGAVTARLVPPGRSAAVPTTYRLGLAAAVAVRLHRQRRTRDRDQLPWACSSRTGSWPARSW